MSTSAIVVMIIAMLVVWGGLALAVLNIGRTPAEQDPDEA
jgi:hypothetical protein